jgi:hypothetical protein
VIQSAILLIHADGTTVNIMLLYVATRSRGVEKIAEPSRLTGKNYQYEGSIAQWKQQLIPHDSGLAGGFGEKVLSDAGGKSFHAGERWTV